MLLDTIQQPYADECVCSRFIASNLAHGNRVSFDCRIVEIGVETTYPCFD
jgi:hypothetical protein